MILQVGSLHSARWKGCKKTWGIRDFESCHGMRINHQNLIYFSPRILNDFGRIPPILPWNDGMDIHFLEIVSLSFFVFFLRKPVPTMGLYCRLFVGERNLENKGGTASGCLNLVHFSSFNVCPCEVRLSTEGDFAHVKNRAALPWQVPSSWKVPLDGKYHGNLRVYANPPKKEGLMKGLSTTMIPKKRPY